LDYILVQFGVLEFWWLLKFFGAIWCLGLSRERSVGMLWWLIINIYLVQFGVLVLWWQES